MRKLLIILVLFGSLSSIAQIRTNISFEKDTIKLGELNNLTIEVISPRAEWVNSYSMEAWDEIKPAESFYANDSLDLQSDAEFEFIDLNTDQRVVLNSSNFTNENGKFVHRNTTRFVAWDVGVFEFPDIDIQIDSSRNEINALALEPSRLIVLPPKSVVVQDTTEIIAPIRTIILEEKSWRDWMWLFYLIAALAIFLLGGLFMYFRKKPEVEEEEIILPAHEIALNRLAQLEQKGLWQKGEIKAYQSELTYTIREYLENRFDIQALESTTGEINKSLQEVGFDSQYTSMLNHILQIADMVKFAQAKPTGSIHQDFLDQAKDFVLQTKAEIIEEDGLVQ